MKCFILRLIFKPSETEKIYLDLFIEISSKSLSSHLFILCSDECLALGPVYMEIG